MVRAEVRAGFAIGDHTQTHPRLQSLGAAGQAAEILGGVRAIVPRPGGP
jgi:peptidoglycan/xylan/chitin deacetylase (PgdA/CDA1 family)